MGDGVNFSFNKGQKLNITKSDGVSSEELLKRDGISSQQKALLQSIFKKYDNGDGILTAEEYTALQSDLVTFAKDDNLGGRELKRFNEQKLGVDKNAYSMEDLQTVIGMMVDGKDGVKTNEDGTVDVVAFLENGGKCTATYMPVDDPADSGKKTLRLSYEYIENGDKITKIEYRDGDRNKISKSYERQGDTTTTITYEDDGVTVLSKKRVTGTVVEEFDPSNLDRITKRETNKGSGVVDTIKYEYDNDGNVTEIYKDAVHGDKPVKTVKKDAQGSVISTTEYDYDGDITTETTTVSDGDPTVVRKDKDGNVIPETSTYDVKPGEVWYNIVAAKYNISDHKTIMNIVHQLKDAAGIDYKSTKMPSQLTLPNEVTVGEQKFTLNVEAAANPDLVRTTPPPPPADEVVAQDPNPPSRYTTPPEKLSSVIIPTVPPMSDSVTGKRLQNVDALMADKTIYNSDGTKTYYDSEGRISYELDAQDRMKYIVYENYYVEYEYGILMGDNPTRYIYRNFDGTVRKFEDYEYDFAGNLTRSIYRDEQGKIIEYVDNLYDAKGNRYRKVTRDANGNVKDYADFEYDSGGEETRAVYRNPDGTIDYYINWDDAKCRNPDGTLQEE